MKSQANSYTSSVSWMLLAACLAVLSLSATADEPEHTTPYPGFRPQTEYALSFLDTVDTATIAVLPTLIRRESRTAHSFASQNQIVAYVNETGIATAIQKSRRVKMPPMQAISQWNLFEYGIREVAGALEGYETDADYTLVMEVLLPVDHAVFGIEVYILDRQGRSAFSFLLNSHHQMFADAKLFAKDSSENARMRMIADATRVGLTALAQQIDQGRKCAALLAANTLQTEAGIFHDFESELVSHVDSHGVPLGFSTFSDGPSIVTIALTAEHPPRPDETDGNHVMQLDLNVTDWAGVVKVFESPAFDTWLSYDWSNFDAFSFWIHGNNSGTLLFVDIMDNRNPCSTGDDAERYAFEFKDDFAGWKRITIPFAKMFRKEIGNGAPNDGLGLSNIHGWGIGATETSGPMTYYIDDFELLGPQPEQP